MQICSAAIQNMLLAANDTGLRSVWLGIYSMADRIDTTTKLFNLSFGVEPLIFISFDSINIGYYQYVNKA